MMLCVHVNVCQVFLFLLVYMFDRFAVREYEYDPQAQEAERKEKEKLERDLKRQFVSLLLTSNTNK